MADIISLEKKRTLFEQKRKEKEIERLEDTFLDEFEDGDNFHMQCTAWQLRELDANNVYGLIGYAYEHFDNFGFRKNALEKFGKALALVGSTYPKNYVVIYTYLDFAIRDPQGCFQHCSDIWNEERTKELSLITLANFSDEDELMELVQAVKDPWKANQEYTNEKLKDALSQAASACEDIFGNSQKKEKAKFRLVRDE